MRILVVEDEHKIANSIKKGLEQESYAVDVAFTGDDGYGLATTEEYDLIILDVLLPGMDGIQIAANLREQNIHIPILMLTAKGQTSDKVTGLDADADDYLTKPFAFEELIARIRALVRRPKDSLGIILSVEDLILNTATYQAKRDNKIIRLSSKEYALLEYLMRHPNQTLTKEQIINHVWDYDADVLPNTVEVYIGYLRNKIDKPFSEKPAIKVLLNMLDPQKSKEVYNLWLEFDEQNNLEAQIVKALDRIEAMIQVLDYRKGYMFKDHLDFTLVYGLQKTKIDPIIAQFSQFIVNKLNNCYKEFIKTEGNQK